jgi:type I restriction enzyme S subunit
MKEWKRYKLNDFIQFNPSEKLPKGTVARKIAMEQLSPFCRYVASNSFESYNGGSKFRNEDTIMARITPCLENGKTAYISSLVNDEIAFGSTEYIVLRNIEGVSDSKFIYYLSISPAIREIAIRSMVGSSGRQRVQQGMLENFTMNLPSLVEQQQIANVLDCLDSKIEINTRINDNLEQQAQALYRSWFVDFEPFKGGIFVDSELGKIPEGWRVGTIGDYSKVRSGYAFKSSWWTNKGSKVIKIKNITTNGKLNMLDCSYVLESNASKAIDFKASTGDVLIAMTGATIGKFCIVPYLRNNIYVNQRVGKFFLGNNPLEKLPFLYGTLRQENIIGEIINKGQGSAQPNISSFDIENVSIIIPTDEVLDSYNTSLMPLYLLVLKNEQENLVLANKRDSLLPKLMSCELKTSNLHS